MISTIPGSEMRTIAASALATLVLLPFAASGVSAGGLDIPPRRAGLWDVQMTPKGESPMPSISMKMCLDPSTDKKMMENGLAMTEGKCSRTDQSRNGDSLVIESTCDFGDGVMTTRATISGDFQSTYKMEIVSDREGGSSPLPKHTEMTQEATWEGECTGDMVPGDVLMMGRKFNVMKMATPGG
jgi:hypothetical protein